MYGPACIPIRAIDQVEIDQVEGELSYQGKTTKQKVYMLKGLKTATASYPCSEVGGKARGNRGSLTSHCVGKVPHTIPGAWKHGMNPMTFNFNQRHSPMLCLPQGAFPYHCFPRSSRSRSKWSHRESNVGKPTPWCAGFVVAPRKVEHFAFV